MSKQELIAAVRAINETASIIDIEGDVTAQSENHLMDAFAQTSRSSQTVILNFSKLAYMNSGGIGLLVTMLIRANRAGQKLCAFGLSEHYKQIFTLTRLDEAILIYETEMDALAVTGKERPS